MRFTRSIHEFQSHIGAATSAVCIGNFDGFHLGHQHLFKSLFNRIEKTRQGSSQNLESVLLTFFPHPRQVIQGIGRSEWRASESGRMLTPLRSKIALASQCGFQHFVQLRFAKALYELTPEAFIETILVKGLHARIVAVGHDWRFGKGRSGDTELLKSLAARYGVDIEVVSEFESPFGRVRSSAVRQALAEGDCEILQGLLGRRFSISGRVIRGEQRGRTLGFPTANLHISNQALPPDGVYAVRVYIDNTPHDAVLNIGVRPTFAGKSRSVEVHLLGRNDFSLYGKRLQLEFFKRIRAEMAFESLEELKKQIRSDIVIAQQILE